MTKRVRCRINRGNLNIGWVLDGIKKWLINFLSGDDGSYLHEKMSFMMRMELCRDKMTESRI